MAGLVPAISLRDALLCPTNRDHRDSALRAGPVMTRKSYFRLIAKGENACIVAID